MQSEPRSPRWLPFMTFLAGVVLTASAVFVLDQARGQEREPSRPSVPLDPCLPDDVPDPEPANAPRQEEGIAEDPDASGAEQLYNALGRGRREDMPPLEDGGAPPAPEDLAQVRFELASRVLQREVNQFLEPPRGAGGNSWFEEWTGPFLEWSRRHIEARLDLAGSDEERIAALRSEIAHTRSLLVLFNELSRGAASGVSAMTILEFDLYRLELETRLAELTSE